MSRLPKLLSCALAAAPLVATAGAAAARPSADQPAPSVEPPRGTKLVIPPEFRTRPADQPAPAATAAVTSIYAAGTLIYMNRDGGIFQPGYNDSRENRSSISGQTFQLPAWDVSDADWAQLMSCIRTQFGAYDVAFTDVDPGAVPHIESVVAGSPQAAGLPNGVGGVSPFTSDCSVIDNSIVFTFADVLPQDMQIICEIAAQEIAHSFGLDHEYLASDPMTYLQSDGPKSFQDVSAPCGEYQARSCRVQGQYDCGYDTQNSVELLTERLGLRADDGPGGTSPSVEIVEPGDGATVPPGFAIVAEVADALELELRIDGVSIAVDDAAPFELSAPADLEPGTHVVELVASDGVAESSHSIAVTVSADADAGDEGDDVDGDGDGDGSGDGSGDGTGPGSQRPDAGITGGCSAGGGAGAGLAWLLLGAAAALRRRSRDA